MKQLVCNPRVIRASCLTAERVPRGSASRQPDGLVGSVVLSVALCETRGDLDRLCRPPSSLWFESRLVEVFARCAHQAFRAPVARNCFTTGKEKKFMNIPTALTCSTHFEQQFPFCPHPLPHRLLAQVTFCGPWFVARGGVQWLPPFF